MRGPLGDCWVWLGGTLMSAMGFPGSCNDRHRHRFDVLDDLAVASDGKIKDAKGFDVPRDRTLGEAVFPEEDDILGVFG